MEVLNEKTTDQSKAKRYRLVVRSAEEAVRVIREKLGESARVLSVRQVGGEGLRKFISSPKLEVIAELPIEDESNIVGIGNDKLSGVGNLEVANAKSEVLANEKSQIDNKSVKEQTGETPNKNSSDSNSIEILKKAGFDDQLLSVIETWSNWSDIKNLSLADTLKEITVGLSDRFKLNDSNPLQEKIAIIGAPGVGKTTTLCKFLAHDVFMNKKAPNVLKIENGVPNPDDALRIFCEVIGVTLFREANKIPSSSDMSPLYLDLPGLSLGLNEEWVSAKEVLDSLNIKTRVLVLNAAYDKQIINKTINQGQLIEATHLAFTHFDEISNSTKLWPILLRNQFTPLCICNGQNVTGDFTTHVLNQMIAKTFPEELYSRGFSSYRKV
jgi:flagellar biosynthesis protein FlhF